MKRMKVNLFTVQPSAREAIPFLVNDYLMNAMILSLGATFVRRMTSHSCEKKEDGKCKRIYYHKDSVE